MEILTLINTLLIISVLAVMLRPRPGANHRAKFRMLLDSSAIIDGRILEVAQFGFMPGVMLVPKFIVAEIQRLSDSADDLKRQRGRYGLEAIRRLQAMENAEVKVIDDDRPDIKEVDDKLVAIASTLGAAVVTNDFNLNKVAAINNVKVLNVNELAQALRPHVLPGEKTHIKLVQRGSDAGQAVGYLDDGTMVVVERSDRLIGREVDVEITKIMQTAAGRMLFARKLVSPRTADSRPAR